MTGVTTDRWLNLQMQLRTQFGKAPDLDAVLFIIGMRELGVLETKFSKEDKVNLMHIAMCRLLSSRGHYALKGLDKDGWPHWELVSPIPPMSLKSQEDLLKLLAVEYFDTLENE